MSWTIEQADCIEFLNRQPPDSLDLVFGSPPYEAQRTYSIGFNLRGQAWVDWMVEVFRSASRVCKGLVAMVVEGSTRDYCYSATPALLMADLHRAGLCLRKPPVFHRRGIPGSGGKDWLRNDYEFIVCVTRPGRLPWSENTAMGHPPKWALGGEISHRIMDGNRVNEKRKTFRHKEDKNTAKGGHDRNICKIANPGNVIHCKVGGGLMGSWLCHETEAPFPEKLAEFFIRSFCRPGGVVCDPFSGSGTTAAVAKRWRRSFVGCDVRESQVELTRRRLGEVDSAQVIAG